MSPSKRPTSRWRSIGPTSGDIRGPVGVEGEVGTEDRGVGPGKRDLSVILGPSGRHLVVIPRGRVHDEVASRPADVCCTFVPLQGGTLCHPCTTFGPPAVRRSGSGRVSGTGPGVSGGSVRHAQPPRKDVYTTRWESWVRGVGWRGVKSPD